MPCETIRNVPHSRVPIVGDAGGGNDFVGNVLVIEDFRAPRAITVRSGGRPATSLPASRLSSGFPGLPDRSGLRRLAEEVVQFTRTDGGDQRVDKRRELVLRADDDPGFALLELDGLGPELDGHDYLTGRVGLPPGPDGLLLCGGLPLAVDLGPSLDGPDVVGVLQELLLLLQPGDELGPAHLDGVVGGLRQGGEGERLQYWHVGSPLLDKPAQS